MTTRLNFSKTTRLVETEAQAKVSLLRLRFGLRRQRLTSSGAVDSGILGSCPT